MKNQFLIASIVLVLTCMTLPATGQISITATGASYSENFDGMGSAGTTYLTGWTGYRYAGTNPPGTLPLVVDNGTLNSGAVYNLGSSGASDRAFGTLASGSTIARIGAHFVNNTGVTITTINLAVVMEQWRSGSSSTANEVNAFAYSFDATDLAGTGTWTNFSAMDLVEKLTTTTSAGAVDGNAAANRTSISGTLTGLSWANGSSMWIRWSDVNDGGSDGDLSIDNLTMSFNIVLAPPGKGTASITPSLAQGALSQSLTVVVRGQSPYTLTNTNVVVPPIFSWSLSTADISLTGGGTPSLSVSGDTIKISGMTVVGTDSIQITINNITPPDSTDTFVFPAQTGTHPDSLLVLSSPPGVLVYGTPHAIGDIKANDANGVPVWSGKWVTILGVVTVGAEFGSPSYIQDATGGIAVYGVITSSEVAIGDEVEILGLISPFNGLTELTSPTLIKKVSSGNVVTPLVLTCNQVNFDGSGGVEQYEGRLVRINQVTVTTLAGGAISAWTVTGSGTNYKLNDPDTLQIRVDNSVNFANTPSPVGPFDVIGVVSQFKNTSPYIGGYQLMPRSTADIISSGPIFATSPVESNLQPTSMRISWTTINNGTTRVRYGLTTAYELGIASPGNALGLSHAVDLTGLTPSTIYHVQAFSDDGANDTSFAGDLVVSSASPAASAGQINVYFNKSVDTSVALSENALGNQNFITLLTSRIDNARRSIDLAVYSLSAAAYGDVIASRLVAAKDRGVSIRVICEADNQNAGGGSIPTLSSNGIPVINDKFDAVWFGAGLMHNKFFVFDGRGGAPESVWVWTGSWNPTNSGTSSDRQNSIEIQDQALAGAYTLEFNQMWGSSTETPNAAVSRFGARKLDITPHNFMINGVPVRLSFSPADYTTLHITNMIAKAQSTVSMAALTLTRKDIADAIIARKNAGRKARVIVDNNTDQGTQFSYLQTNLVDIRLKGGSGLLHHKYTTIDGDLPTGPGYIETGSHNYSNSAENSNDENSLFFESKRMANLFLQEFAARYYEAGGTDSIHVGTAAGFSISKSSINFDTVLTIATKTDSFTVSNPGNLALVVAPLQISNAMFTVLPESATVAPSGTQKFYVTFAPNAVGPQSGTIILAFNSTGSPDTVAVQGVGKSGAQPLFQVTPSTLAFGTRLVGSSTIDSFTVSNSGTALLHLLSISSTNPRFSVVPAVDSVVATGSKKFHVTFSPLAGGTQSGEIILVHDAAGSPDTVSVQGAGQTVGGPISISLDYLAGWNMISLPLIVDDARTTTLFPGASSAAYAYIGSYVTRDTLVAGKGYWLKFPSAQSDSLTGLPDTLETIAVSSGWNMIGAITNDVPIASVIQTPSGIVQSNYFGYHGAYLPTDSLKRGKAYWVKANQAGTLTLASSYNVPAPHPARKKPDVNWLKVTDAQGRSQVLYFGEARVEGEKVQQWELPPAAPEGAMDVRFSNGGMMVVFGDPENKVTTTSIRVRSAVFPMKIEWSLETQDANTYTLSASGSRSPMKLQASGAEQFNTAVESFILSMVQSGPLPEAFALGQNYPNPFNPSTSISFALPLSAVVSLDVFNVLGEQVAQLVDRVDYTGGVHMTTWDASTMPSGLYIYRLTAVANDDARTLFQQQKKLILMK